MGFQPDIIVPAIHAPINREGITSLVTIARVMATKGGSTDRKPKSGLGFSASAAKTMLAARSSMTRVNTTTAVFFEKPNDLKLFPPFYIFAKLQNF
jgi:hypothetical protein